MPEVGWLAGMTPELGESGVLLVTDTNARSGPGRAYFAAGRVGRDTPVRAISPQAWDSYCDKAAGADDLRPAVLKTREEPQFRPGEPEYADVSWPARDSEGEPGPVVAKRLRARRYLHPGQPVWVRLTGRDDHRDPAVPAVALSG